ncbi:MAG: nitrilase-related carbon-nitrogen hydrolase, partial [Acidimicrobiia bacterium]
MRSIRVALAQINANVGAIDHNADRILQVYQTAADSCADVVIFPELTITGYPPEDLLLRPAFVNAATHAIAQVARSIGETAAIIGGPILGRDLA